MKKILLSIALVFLVSVYMATPVQWFQIELKMNKKEIYTLCGPPTDTDLWDIKGERWQSLGPVWKWTMFIGLTKGYASYSSIWLDIGKKGDGLRIFLKNDGKWNIHI
jgi:hypothetical protein